MMPTPEIPVTLSGELFHHLRGLATVLDVPLHWLVAGLVCDTVEGLAARRLCAGAQARLDHPRPTPALPTRRSGARRTVVPA